MKYSELKRIIDTDFINRIDDPEVVIEIKLPYATVGCTPFVKVKTAWHGFDWEMGKFFITSEVPVTEFDDTKYGDILKNLQDKVGWQQYEISGLKSEIKRLKKLKGIQDE